MARRRALSAPARARRPSVFWFLEGEFSEFFLGVLGGFRVCFFKFGGFRVVFFWGGWGASGLGSGSWGVWVARWFRE